MLTLWLPQTHNRCWVELIFWGNVSAEHSNAQEGHNGIQSGTGCLSVRVSVLRCGLCCNILNIWVNPFSVCQKISPQVDDCSREETNCPLTEASKNRIPAAASTLPFNHSKRISSAMMNVKGLAVLSEIKADRHITSVPAATQQQHFPRNGWKC